MDVIRLLNNNFAQWAFTIGDIDSDRGKSQFKIYIPMNP